MTARTLARAAGATALAVAACVLVAPSAQASAYRYWTYWQAPTGTTSWAFATQGPGTSLPADGSVEGWSFGVTTESGSADDAPSIAPEFDAICADTPAAAGSKRVALVVDTGPAAVAPDGEVPPAPIATCVLADQQASGYEILRSVVEVRTEDGLVCGVAGYPARECAPVLDDAEANALLAAAAAAPAPTGSASAAAGSESGMAADQQPVSGGGTPWATLAVGALLIAGAAIGVAIRRRARPGGTS